MWCSEWYEQLEKISNVHEQLRWYVCSHLRAISMEVCVIVVKGLLMYGVVER